MKMTLATIAALTFAGAAVAQGVGFAELDADKNGALSYSEVTAALPDTTKEAFTAADTDANGTLSKAEFKAATTKTNG
ncbi:hypothetical protein [Stappia stellulata]|uniref:hypothetical protein n=1 Tax=Stappia stellulata TaxID=71235 RepID=UPI000406DA03|nr:hypothetical protein [Stappia stellulata]